MIDHCIFCNETHELFDDMGRRFSAEDCPVMKEPDVNIIIDYETDLK